LQLPFPLALTVGHIVGVGAEEQVLGPETGWVVAAMEDMQAALIVEVEEERGSRAVDGQPSMGHRDPPVAPAIPPTLPQPATALGINPAFGKEPIE
jgi:hypothetical protein